LRENWFATASDLAAMAREDAAALGVPLRMLSFVSRALGGGGSPAGGPGRATGSWEVSGSEDEAGGWARSGSGAAAAEASGSGSAASEDEAGGAAGEGWHEDLMQRRAPGLGHPPSSPTLRVTKKVQLPRYGLTVRGVCERPPVCA
jgi:hypothetical protein